MIVNKQQISFCYLDVDALRGYVVKMFVLAELKDTVRIPPWDFKRKINDAITDELNRKLANKVVYYEFPRIC